MDGFNYYVGKKVYIILKSKRVYSGIITDVENVGNGIVWISMIDKLNRRVTFASGEIDVIQEEE